ncbi:MAG: DUF3592 domain-containing protein [Limisphaerales bacterium]
MFSLRNMLWAITALSFAFIAAALLWLLVSTLIVTSHVRANGTVIKSIKEDHGAGVYYRPVAVFRDQAGVEHTVRASGGSNPPRFPVGTTVAILYHTNKPEDGMIEDRFILWGAPLCLMAIAFFYGGACFTVRCWLDKKAAATPPLIVRS